MADDFKEGAKMPQSATTDSADADPALKPYSDRLASLQARLREAQNEGPGKRSVVRINKLLGQVERGTELLGKSKRQNDPETAAELQHWFENSGETPRSRERPEKVPAATGPEAVAQRQASATSLDAEDPDVQDAIDTYFHTLDRLGNLRERATAESETEAKQHLDQEITQGEQELRALEAGLRKEGARGVFREADFDRRVVEERLWQAFRSSQFMKEIPPERWEEVKQPISNFRSFLIGVSGRVMRVGAASAAYLAGDTLTEGRIDVGVAKQLSMLLSYAGAELATHTHRRWSKDNRKVDFAKVVYSRMLTRESTANKRLHRIIRDVALSEGEKAERAKQQVYRQYSRLVPEFQDDNWRRPAGNIAVMAVAGTLVESAKWMGRWLLL